MKKFWIYLDIQADGFNADREEVRLQDAVIIEAACMFLRLVGSQNSKQRN